MMVHSGVICSSRRIKQDRTSSIVAAIGPIPFAPTAVQVSGSTSGQKDISWDAPTTLFDGSDISLYPVASYKVRVRRVDSDALVGGSPVTVFAPSLSTTITGLPAVDLYVTVSAVNVNDESDESLPEYWTGT